MSKSERNPALNRARTCLVYPVPSVHASVFSPCLHTVFCNSAIWNVFARSERFFVDQSDCDSDCTISDLSVLKDFNFMFIFSTHTRAHAHTHTHTHTHDTQAQEQSLATQREYSSSPQSRSTLALLRYFYTHQNRCSASN